MKKILTLFIVFAIITLSCMTAFAAPLCVGANGTAVDENSGMVLDIKENAGGLVDVTVKIKGTVHITGFYTVIQYDKSKVVPFDGTNPAGNLRLGTAALIAPYYSLLATNFTTRFALGNFIIDNRDGQPNYAKIGYSKLGPTDFLSSVDYVGYGGTASEVSIFKLKFKLVSGQKLSSDTIKYSTAATSIISNLTDNFDSTVSAAAFTTVYSALPSGFVVTYDPANGGAITTPTQSKFAFPADPVKQGYDFIGWFNGATQYTNDADVTEAVTLTASYTFNSATAPADPKSGSIDVKTGPSTTGTVTAAKIMTIGGKIPAGAVAGEDFGIIINGKKFQSLSDPANCPGGLFIIKLVDVTGNVLTGSYNAFNYYKTTTSLTPVVVSGQ